MKKLLLLITFTLTSIFAVNLYASDLTQLMSSPVLDEIHLKKEQAALDLRRLLRDAYNAKNPKMKSVGEVSLDDGILALINRNQHTPEGLENVKDTLKDIQDRIKQVPNAEGASEAVKEINFDLWRDIEKNMIQLSCCKAGFCC